MLEKAVISILRLILDRYSQNGSSYPFIDMKIDTTSGNSFPENDEGVLGTVCAKNTILIWIQGRGLEALAGHYSWLKNTIPSPKDIDLESIKTMSHAVLEKLETFRKQNYGRMWFLFDTSGNPFTFNEHSSKEIISLKDIPYNFSDLFYVKGLLASSIMLNDSEKTEKAKTYCKEILNAILSKEFKSDQISFDPKNKVVHIPEKLQQGPAMIAIGACALFADLTKEKEWIEYGYRLISFIIKNFINTDNKFQKTQPYDFFEACDKNSKPWIEKDGTLLSDPGHALEFTGLTAKFLKTRLKIGNLSEDETVFMKEMCDLLPLIFFKNFNNGWNNQVGGICKSFNLITGTPVNTDMPWWSLPETMRAAILIRELTHNDSYKKRLFDCYKMCSDAFCRNFINQNAYMMAYQTINEQGAPINVVPATPDADPGYHTGLSLIDIFKCTYG
jgi:mannose/cellobiose epimerase-like protein (N-acyl-D-glucosamine 2-epimerase family)